MPTSLLPKIGKRAPSSSPSVYQPIVSRAAKSNTQIAQALEADVDVEIVSMATDGINEPCNNPKGFNSPVFAVHKKNKAVRVVSNFKKSSKDYVIPNLFQALVTLVFVIGNNMLSPEIPTTNMADSGCEST